MSNMKIKIRKDKLIRAVVTSNGNLFLSNQMKNGGIPLVLSNQIKELTLKDKSKYKISHHDDYHEIIHCEGKYKTLEIGCFPVKGNSFGYCRYFGLFYTGRKPTFSQVWPSLERKIDFGKCNHNNGEDISVTKSEVQTALKKTLKRQADNIDYCTK